MRNDLLREGQVVAFSVKSQKTKTVWGDFVENS